MALLRSTTSPNPARINFTEISTRLWNGSVLNAADFFTNATPGNHKPRSTVNHFGGSLGGPIVHDKLFFFFDSEWVRHRASHRHGRYGTDPGVSKLRPPATSAGRQGRGHRIRLPSRHRSPCRSIRKCFRSTETPAARRSLFSAVRSIQTAARPPAVRRMETVAPTGKAFRIPATTTSKSRRLRLDYNISAKNTAWFRFQADTGSASRVHRSDQFPYLTRFLRSRSIPSPPATRTFFRRTL